MRISIHTLGCRLNQADSAHMASDLVAHGHEIVPWGEECDVAIVNSCAVTGVASRKSRQMASSARRAFPGAKIVVMGCDASAEGQRFVEDGLADLVVANPKPVSIADLIATLDKPRLVKPEALSEGFKLGTPPSVFLDKSRPHIKIQEGCDFRCTYCIVPDTRGHAVSRDWQDVMQEVKSLADAGFRELVVTGVNVATYRNGGMDLADLLRKMLEVGPDFRIRLGSTESGGPVMPRLAELIKEEPRICRFLHLPIQYGEDSILRRMGRHYSSGEFREHAAMAMDAVPGLCLGTDIIVGFPGETEEVFQDCLKYVEEMPFGLMHVFVYSPRPGTVAATWKDRPAAAVAKRRSEMLLAIAARKAETFARSQIGQTLDVIIEHIEPGSEHGWSDNYLKVFVKNGEGLQINDLVKVKVEKFLGDRDVVGTVVER